MSSGGGKTTTTTNDPPKWAIPYFQQGLGMATSVANRPYTPYTGQMTAGLNDGQYAAMNMTANNAMGSGPLNYGNAWTQAILSNDGQFTPETNPYMGAQIDVGVNPFLGQNPYLDQMVASSNSDIATAYNQTELPTLMGSFNSGGAYGGTAMADAMQQSQSGLAGRLAQNSSNLRFQDYTTQQQLAEAALNRSVGAQQADLARNSQLADGYLGRSQGAWDSYQNRQLQAAGLTPGLNEANYYGANQLYGMGRNAQLNEQQGLDAQYNEWLRGQGWDQDRLSSLAQLLSAVQGGSTTGPNPNYRSAGQNAATWGALIASMYGGGN